ncbi:MAG: glycosyltransferase [Bacteroidetes bacterium]|nr:glycosyltransferase [Bacteroidota bacterium]
MDKDIKITVLMPVYNAELYLKEAIDSILSQTFTDFEFLIINDGSSDSSKEIILSYNDSRIRYVENESNLQLIATLNKGFDMSQGKYIARMDNDDISFPNRLKQQYEFMESNPEVAVCGSWFELFGETSKIVKYSISNDDIRVRMLYQTQFCHPSVFFRRDILIKNNYKFNPNFIHADDYEFFVRIAEKHKVANLPYVLLKYRTHKEKISIIYKNIQNENTKKIIVNQFRKLKNDFNDDDYFLYFNFAYTIFSWFNKHKVKKLDELLSLLIKENNKILFLPTLKLKEYWADMFFHLCYNVDGCMDIWRNSIFYDKKKMTFFKTIKKYLKRE